MGLYRNPLFPIFDKRQKGMSTLPLDLLASFAKVAEHSSITMAARDLGVSKATVSKHLSELELRLGVILFARTTRSLTLTDAGHKAYARAQRIMTEADLIAEDAHDSAMEPRGRLTIAVPHVFSALWLAEAIPDFLRQYADVTLELRVDDRLIDVVRDGVDGAVRISARPDSSLVSRFLAPIKLCLVAAPSYWSAHGQPQHPQDLAQHACFAYSNAVDQAAWRFIGPQGDEVRVKVSGPLTVNGGGVEMPALRAGLGVALMPDFAICHDVRAGKLEVARMNWHPPALTLHFLTPPGRGRPKRLQAFSDFLVQRFGGRQPPWSLGDGGGQN
jgi:DNA-binding transcriptional LysR family regulator